MGDETWPEDGRPHGDSASGPTPPARRGLPPPPPPRFAPPRRSSGPQPPPPPPPPPPPAYLPYPPLRSSGEWVPRHAARPSAFRRARTPVVVVACVAAAAGLVAAVAITTDGDDEVADTTGTPAATAATTSDATPAELFTAAGEALVDAGTFSYEATSTVEAPDLARGNGSITIDRDLRGDVVLPDAVRETVDDPFGMRSERITLGDGLAHQTWYRDTAYPDQIGQRPWGEVEGEVGELDLFLLPSWLDGAIDHRDGGEDRNGRRIAVASVPVALVPDLGPDVEVIDLEVELTVDDDGVPHQVLVELSMTDLVLESTYRIADIGGGRTVEPPSAGQLDVTPWFNEQDLAAFDGPPPLGLSGIPEGWELTGAAVVVDDVSSCPAATVQYQDLENPTAEYLWIRVSALDCAYEATDEPFEVLGYRGAVDDFGDGARAGVVVSGDTAVSFLTDLSLGDVKLVLATLGPLDLAATPEPLAGIPSSGT